MNEALTNSSLSPAYELVDRYAADAGDAVTCHVAAGAREWFVRIEQLESELIATGAPESVCEWVLSQDALTEFAWGYFGELSVSSRYEHERVA